LFYWLGGKKKEHLGHYNNIELWYVYSMPHNSRLR
jgi:hypothetical protein